MEIKNIALLAVILLSGCTTVFESKGGIVLGQPRTGFSTGTFSHRPSYAIDYLGGNYYFYGQSVYVLLPSMIYGNGWSGRGWYHARPNRKYNGFGQEEIWTN